jgi:hypothetical protein
MCLPSGRLVFMDLQQIDRLFAQTLAGDYDDESPWNAVRALHGIGSRGVFDRAVQVEQFG